MARYKEKGMRYIDADELYETVTKKYSDIVAGCYTFNIVAYDMARLVKEAPTADVVPKSEYERLAKELERVEALYWQKDSEVAREIFEEIEYNFADLRKVEYANAPLQIVFNLLDYLKKKYTESENGRANSEM